MLASTTRASRTRAHPFRKVRSRLRTLEVGFHPLVGALMLVLFGFHLLTFREETWWGDSYQYLLHAKNLLAAHAYADTGYVPSPHSFFAPAAYPLGYPLLIAPLVAIFGASPQGLAMLASLFLLGTAWVTATLSRGWLPAPYAVGLAALIALQPGLIAMSRQPLSDPPFLFFVMLCLLAADRASYKKEPWNRRVALAGLALGAAAVTRTLGLVLIPALLLPGLVRHRRLQRSALTSAGIGLAIWLVVSLIPLGAPALTGTGGGAEGYGALVEENLLRQLVEVPARVPERIVDYTRASFPLWHVPGRDVVKNLLFLVALIPVGVGFLHRARRRFGPAEAFAVLYVLALLPWSFSAPRYLFPLYPLYYLYLIVGAWRLGRDRLRRQWAINTALVAAVALSFGGRYLEWASGPPTVVVDEDDAALYRYVQATAPEDAVLLTSGDPRVATYYTQRPASVGPEELGTWLAYADQLEASYALVRDGHEIAPALVGDTRHRLVRRDGDLSLYRICPGGCATPAPD